MSSCVNTVSRPWRMSVPCPTAASIPQFNRESLAGSLYSREMEYVYLGRELGGRSNDPACYEDGRVRFNLHPAGDLFRMAEPREKLVAEAIELQAKRVAFVNKKLSTSGESNR